MAGTYDTIKKATQDVIAPQLQELKGEIVGTKGELSGLRGELRQLEKRMEEGFGHVHQHIDEVSARTDEKVSHLGQRVEDGFKYLNQRVDTVNERIGDALEGKLAARSN